MYSLNNTYSNKYLSPMDIWVAKLLKYSEEGDLSKKI